MFTVDYFMVDMIIKTNGKNEKSIKMTLSKLIEQYTHTDKRDLFQIDC